MPSPVTPKQVRSKETRRRFALAAKKLFTARAYHDVTLEMIADLAKRNPGSIFRYWQGKAALWRSVMECEPPIDEGLSRAAPEVFLTGYSALRAALSDLRRAVAANMDHAAIVAAIDAMLERPDWVTGGGQAAEIDQDLGVTDIRKEASEETHAMVRIGSKIRHRRRELKLSQFDLAEALGCSVQQISRYESGTAYLPVTRLLVIAGRLECSVHDLVVGPAPLSGPVGKRQWVRRRNPLA